MFQFRRFPTYAYLIQRRLTEYCSAGFPHSVIHGSMLMCSSPWLIAACHDLLRLLMPRHSPCALSSLTSSEQTTLAPCHVRVGRASRPGFPSSRAKSRRLRHLPTCPSLRSIRSGAPTLTLLWFSSTVKNYAGNSTGGSIWLIALPLLKFPQSLWILCCLLHISGMFLLCSVFKVQPLTIKVRFQYSVP